LNGRVGYNCLSALENRCHADLLPFNGNLEIVHR
jgi:hypothetical protein